jgi:hypothetical protein
MAAGGRIFTTITRQISHMSRSLSAKREPVDTDPERLPAMGGSGLRQRESLLGSSGNTRKFGDTEDLTFGEMVNQVRSCEDANSPENRPGGGHVALGFGREGPVQHRRISFLEM